MNYINDVPLYNEGEDTVNLVIEICPGTSNKTELVTPRNERLICVRQVEGIYPFYYGSFPKTYAGDKDPLDFILFTDIKHQKLDIVKAEVIGAIKTIDAGEQDDKIICVEANCGLTNLTKYMKEAMKFLKTYKGKNADMIIDKKLASMEDAEQLVAAAHENWKKQRETAIVRRVTPTNGITTKVKINTITVGGRSNSKDRSDRIRIIKR